VNRSFYLIKLTETYHKYENGNRHSTSYILLRFLMVNFQFWPSCTCASNSVTNSDHEGNDMSETDCGRPTPKQHKPQASEHLLCLGPGHYCFIKSFSCIFVGWNWFIPIQKNIYTNNDVRCAQYHKEQFILLTKQPLQ